MSNLKKFKVSVEKIYFVEHIVEAEDRDHALEIAGEISDEMELNYKTFFESNNEAQECVEDEQVTFISNGDLYE